MKVSLKSIGFVLILVFLSCKEQPKTTEEASKDKSVAQPATALVPEEWIQKRVSKASERLKQTDAGKVVWDAMEAHGGLEKWYTNGALSFRFDYQPLDGSTRRNSFQTVDTWSNRARHTSVTDTTAHFGYTGKLHWVQAQDSTAFAYDTKFWALTPFYFLGQPFVLDGEGVNLEMLPQTTYQNRLNDVVKVTFDPGTGDAPDDYYILYFDAESHLLKVIRYIVSYPAYFKDGDHLPEKFMEVLGSKTVSGIVFPTGYKTHWLAKNGLPGEYITKIEVSDIRFEGSLETDFFEAPEDARIIE